MEKKRREGFTLKQRRVPFVHGRTLGDAIEIEGAGIHTGQRTKITIHPSPRRGIFFYKNGVEIPAHHRFVAHTQNSTDLSKDGETVKTVEHLMAAFYLLGIDSAVVEVDGPEIPIADGSAKVFIDLFGEVGIEELEHYQVYYKIILPYRIQPNGIHAEIKPFGGEKLVYEGEFPPFGRIRVTYRGGEIGEALVGARTFCPVEKVPLLWLENFGRGGNIINTLPLTEDLRYLVYRKEPAYHKLLDLIGDTALLGGRVFGEIYSFKGGHNLNHGVREAILKGGIAVKVEADRLIEGL